MFRPGVLDELGDREAALVTPEWRDMLLLTREILGDFNCGVATRWGRGEGAAEGFCSLEAIMFRILGEDRRGEAIERERPLFRGIFKGDICPSGFRGTFETV